MSELKWEAWPPRARYDEHLLLRLPVGALMLFPRLQGGQPLCSFGSRCCDERFAWGLKTGTKNCRCSGCDRPEPLLAEPDGVPGRRGFRSLLEAYLGTMGVAPLEASLQAAAYEEAMAALVEECAVDREAFQRNWFPEEP